MLHGAQYVEKTYHKKIHVSKNPRTSVLGHFSTKNLTLVGGEYWAYEYALLFS